jgi:hypothetical protein
MRISVDFRYQVEGEPLTELVLHPHFGRLTWDEIYENWSPDSDRFRYYWRDLDFEVVPFVDFDLVSAEEGPRAWEATAPTLGEAIVEGVEKGSLSFSPDEWREIMTLEAKREARYERHLERIAKLGISPDPDEGEAP